MLDLSLLAPAFVAGLLVLFTHIPLGRAVLKRGIIFIDLAIAQIAGLGLILAHAIGWDVHGFETQIVALVAAISGALLLSKAENIIKDRLEAFIGISFVLAATAGLLLLAHDPHGGEHLRELLIGQILWTTWDTLIPLGVISLLFVLLYWQIPNLLSGTYFYVIFAVVITFSVQIVGVYLVFSSLIIPAFAVYREKRHPLLHAFLIGVTGYLVGLLISMKYDMPTGATIVWSSFVIAMGYLGVRKLVDQNKN